MTNKEKLIDLMKQHNIHKVFYSAYMDLDAKKPEGELLFEAEEDFKFMSKVYELYDHNVFVDYNMFFLVRMMPDTSASLDRYRNGCMKLLCI